MFWQIKLCRKILWSTQMSTEISDLITESILIHQSLWRFSVLNMQSFDFGILLSCASCSDVFLPFLGEQIFLLHIISWHKMEPLSQSNSIKMPSVTKPSPRVLRTKKVNNEDWNIMMISSPFHIYYSQTGGINKHSCLYTCMGNGRMPDRF